MTLSDIKKEMKSMKSLRVFYAVRDLINPKRVIDIGANHGWFASCLGQICPDVDITMIEANPNCQNILSKIGYPYIMVALSNKVDERVKFYINKDDNICSGASLYKENTDFYIDCQEIEVETHLLDELKIYPEGIDLIKIDVQGSEKDILEGSINTLKRTKNVLLECTFSNYNIGAPQIEEVISSIENFGFYPNQILEEHWSRPEVDLPVKVIHQIDVLFSKVKNNHCENKILQYRKNFDEVISGSNR